MISYSLDGITRRSVILTFAGFAVFLAFIISNAGIGKYIYEYLIDRYDADGVVIFLAKILGYSVDTGVGVTIIFGLMFFAFDRWFWKVGLISRWLNIPDLSGEWIGTINREQFPDGDSESGVPVKICIRQSFSLMSFELNNPVNTSMSKRTCSQSGIIGISGTQKTAYLLREGFNFKADSGKEVFGTTIWTVEEDQDGTFMSGEYVSNFPRKGQLVVRRVDRGQVCLCGAIRVMKNSDDGEYLGIQVPMKHVQKFIRQLEKKKTHSCVAQWADNRHKRDGKRFHLTVVSPPEYETLSKDQINTFLLQEVNYVLKYLGASESREAETYYITVSSPHIEFLRKNAGLAPHNLHVTLGFTPHDIHNVYKGDDNKLETRRPWFSKSVYNRL